MLARDSTVPKLHVWMKLQDTQAQKKKRRQSRCIKLAQTAQITKYYCPQEIATCIVVKEKKKRPSLQPIIESKTHNSRKV